MSDKTSDKRLLPCPFCGGEVRLMYYDVEGDGSPSCINSEEELEASPAFVHCYNCDTDFMHHSDIARDVLVMWNTRKPMDKIVERLEEEAEECRKYWCEFDDVDSFGGMHAYLKAIEIVKGEENE